MRGNLPDAAFPVPEPDAEPLLRGGLRGDGGGHPEDLVLPHEPKHTNLLAELLLEALGRLHPGARSQHPLPREDDRSVLQVPGVGAVI